MVRWAHVHSKSTLHCDRYYHRSLRHVYAGTKAHTLSFTYSGKYFDADCDPVTDSIAAAYACSISHTNADP